MRIRFLCVETMALPCWPLWWRFRERSNEGALSSTGSAWVCRVVCTNGVPFQAHHEKNTYENHPAVWKSSCQILNMVFFNHMDIDIDSDTPDRKKKNVTPRAVRRYVTMTFAQCDFQGRLPRLQTTVLEARPVVRNFAGHCVSVRRIFFDPYFAHPCDESFLWMLFKVNL